MAKVHLRVLGVDKRNEGQTDFEHQHQSACGYVRNNVTTKYFEVTCLYCKRSEAYDTLKNDIK